MRWSLAIARRLLACPNGTALVGYTSLTLLLAVAAIALLAHADGIERPPGAKATSSN
jgi:hypothetical protein